MHFRPTQDGSLCEKFFAVKQEGLVAEFRRAFEVLAAPLKDLPDEVLESTFMNGLLPKIWAEICLLCPTGLSQIMEAAQKVEDQNWVLSISPENSQIRPKFNQGKNVLHQGSDGGEPTYQ